MVQPEMGRLTPEQQKQLRSIAYWADKMDSQWSVFGVPIGWDAVCGLLPIIGDAVTACISLALVNKARKMLVPKRLLLRMLANVAVDFFCGALPVLGDFFDLSWRANSKNISLLEQYYGIGQDRLVVTGYWFAWLSLLSSIAVLLLYFTYGSQYSFPI